MMRICSLFTALVVTPLLAQTQVKAQQAPTTGKKEVLKDSYAAHGLRVLKMIVGEPGSFDIGSDGGFLVPQATQKAVDDLDADARTKTELLVVNTLQSLLTGRLMHNTAIGSISAKISLAMTGTEADKEPTRDIHIAEITSRSPSVIEMRRKELECSTAIDSLLRSRKFSAVSACDPTALSVPNLKNLDVSVQ